MQHTRHIVQRERGHLVGVRVRVKVRVRAARVRVGVRTRVRVIRVSAREATVA